MGGVPRRGTGDCGMIWNFLCFHGSGCEGNETEACSWAAIWTVAKDGEIYASRVLPGGGRPRTEQGRFTMEIHTRKHQGLGVLWRQPRGQIPWVVCSSS